MFGQCLAKSDTFEACMCVFACCVAPQVARFGTAVSPLSRGTAPCYNCYIWSLKFEHLQTRKLVFQPPVCRYASSGSFRGVYLSIWIQYAEIPPNKELKRKVSNNWLSNWRKASLLIDTACATRGCVTVMHLLSNLTSTTVLLQCRSALSQS